MHAFLIIGKNEIEIDKRANQIALRKQAILYEFPLQKIADTRELGAFVKLGIAKPTAIYIKHIDAATEETLNAFLKNLEEPQDKLQYILTAESLSSILPTIVSRCQIVKIQDTKSNTLNEDIARFLEMKTGEKLTYLDKIKSRDEAIEFIRDFIEYNHQTLHLTNADYQVLLKRITAGEKLHKALRANGNLILQLTDFVISLDS